MSDLLHVFIGESRENLESASLLLEKLHSDGYSQDAIDNVFRDLHTIKGSSDLFDIKPLTSLAHAAEDLLDSLRDGSTPLNESLCDLLLEALDQISNWFDELESGSENVEKWQPISTELAGRIRACIHADTDDADGGESEQAAQQSEASASVSAAPESFLALGSQTQLQCIEAALECEQPLWQVNYTPDSDCFFRGEDPLTVATNTPELIAIQVTPSKDALNDVFQCHLDIVVHSSADDTAIANHFAYYEGQYQRESIALGQLVSAFWAASEEYLVAAEQGELWQAYLDGDMQHSARLAEMVGMGEDVTPEEAAMCRIFQLICQSDTLTALLESVTHPADNDSVDVSADTPLQQNQDNETPEDTGVNQARNEILSQQLIILQSMDNNADSPVFPSVKRIVTGLLGESHTQEASTPNQLANAIEQLLNATTPVETEDAPDELVTPVVEESTAAPETTETVSETAESAPKQERQAPKTLKVNQEKIDYLMDLIGELTVAKNSLPYLAKQAEDIQEGRKLSKQIKAHFSIVNRLTEELQSAVLQIRMVPVSHVFQRYPRLVRELARKLNKKIDLVMQGEDTEFDKNLIESLSEPLIHLLRNSIDHGIEAPSDRGVAGKSETGTIVLSAMPQDDNVVIEIRDDGKGIDAEKIKMLAYQKGIIQEHQLDTLTEEESLQLIFAAGFSTSEQVSDLSGRGVGMDAVRTMVAQAGGTIEMQSKVGEGTQFKLILPQTMSVNRIMMFEVNHQMFGIGLDSVVETVKVSQRDIELIRNNPVLMLREKIIPLHCLRTLLQLPVSDNESDEVCVLVVNNGQGDFGLIIDKFHEGIDVIQKPLEGVMAGFNHFSGTALLGDGRVLLIINLQELLSCR